MATMEADNLAAELIKLPRELFKRAASRYLDLSEQIAEQFFKMGQNWASAIEQTPIYPLLEFQQTFSRKAFEYYLKGARLLIGSL